MELSNHEEFGAFVIRHDFKPGDLGSLVSLHGILYAREYGFDLTFEAYVAGPLAAFVCARTDRDRIWIAERDNRIVGCIAIVGTSAKEAQLRWYLVDPSARGMGLGKHLLREATSFCKRRGYESVFLWTVEALTLAARLYQSAGFVKVEVRPAKQWGVEVIEQKYVLDLGRHVTNIRVEVTNPTSPAARALLAALDEYQLSLYPPESVHLLSAESLSQPNVVFMGAFQNGELVGCGAYVNHDTYGELKRMFVRPDVGGLGIGRRILESLEKHATASRITLLRLETGTAQHQAIRLYENAGYARCGPFGSYTDDHLSVFMQKQLPVSE